MTRQPKAWHHKLGQPKIFVLYLVADGWRHATYTTNGVLDGKLPDLDTDASFEQASKALVAITEQWCGTAIEVRWHLTDKPGWWTGEITLTNHPPN